MISGSTQHLSYLFDTAIKSGQQEILDWYNYSLEFESKVYALTADGRIKDKMVRSMIYKEMKLFIPTKITQDNLYKKTFRARKHLMFFGKNGVRIDKIKLVSYRATEISKLTNSQIQNVIDQVKMITSDHQSHVTLNTVPQGNDQIKAE
ncbi:3392_t:CDS:1, partial [Funneliformis geosporum]